MKNTNNQPKTLKEKICIFFVLLGFSTIFYFFLTSLTKKRMEEIEFINQDFQITRGIVVKKSVHKGRHIRVEYIVNGKLYQDSDGFDINKRVEEGDSIYVKYSKTNPELMITEFNEKY